jgi:poly-gamma-glutamate biosynthesis protein PgsC/CapC
VVELSVVLGIFLGLLFYEFIGFSPGGLVAPGYIALFLDQPVRVVGTFIVSLLTLLLIRWASNYFIMFGRRRFAVIMLASFLLRWLWEMMLLKSPVNIPELRVVGYIVPGLIANDMERQGVVATICALIIVSTFVRLGLFILQGWNLLLP